LACAKAFLDLSALTGVNLVGPITLTSKSKDIKLEQFTQSVQLDLERGDIELRPHAVPLAKIQGRIRNVGNIDLALLAQGKFELVASTMRMSEGGVPSIQVSTARGTLTVRKE